MCGHSFAKDRGAAGLAVIKQKNGTPAVRLGVPCDAVGGSLFGQIQASRHSPSTGFRTAMAVRVST